MMASHSALEKFGAHAVGGIGAVEPQPRDAIGDVEQNRTFIDHGKLSAFRPVRQIRNESVNSAFSLLTRITFLYAMRSSPST